MFHALKKVFVVENLQNLHKKRVLRMKWNVSYAKPLNRGIKIAITSIEKILKKIKIFLEENKKLSVPVWRNAV